MIIVDNFVAVSNIFFLHYAFCNCFFVAFSLVISFLSLSLVVDVTDYTTVAIITSK